MEEMNAEVLECSRYGEAEDLLQLLEAGADVNTRDQSGNTAMHKVYQAVFDHCSWSLMFILVQAVC